MPNANFTPAQQEAARQGRRDRQARRPPRRPRDQTIEALRSCRWLDRRRHRWLTDGLPDGCSRWLPMILV